MERRERRAWGGPKEAGQEIEPGGKNKGEQPLESALFSTSMTYEWLPMSVNVQGP